MSGAEVGTCSGCQPCQDCGHHVPKARIPALCEECAVRRPDIDPRAVAFGDQLQARVEDIARQLLASQLDGEVLTADEQAAFDAGVGAGSAAAMLALKEAGLLP